MQKGNHLWIADVISVCARHSLLVCSNSALKNVNKRNKSIKSLTLFEIRDLHMQPEIIAKTEG